MREIINFIHSTLCFTGRQLLRRANRCELSGPAPVPAVIRAWRRSENLGNFIARFSALRTTTCLALKAYAKTEWAAICSTEGRLRKVAAKSVGSNSGNFKRLRGATTASQAA